MEEDNSITFMAENYCNLVYVKASFLDQNFVLAKHFQSPIPPGWERFMFGKGSRFVKMFNRAIDENKYPIELIKRKYLEHNPPSKCAIQNMGPAALCE
jgi:hypothetical protein